jgi:3D (Asp-Asp-Asp) domain-containing protein
MKIIQIIKEEVVPLSSRKQLILLLIIACIFQFVLFYTPALADEAASQHAQANSDQEMVIINDSIAKGGIISQNQINLTSPALASSTEETASSTSLLATSTPSLATSTPVKVLKTSKHVITAYNSDIAQTDDDPCTTANGFNVCQHNQEDTIAANFLKFGTKVKIPALFGERIFVVRDRMNSKHANRVDVWMKTHADAINFGVKTAEIQVVS